MDVRRRRNERASERVNEWTNERMKAKATKKNEGLNQSARAVQAVQAVGHDSLAKVADAK